MSAPPAGGSGSFSLFPRESSTTPKPPPVHPRKQQPRANAPSPSEMSPPRNGRTTPQQQPPISYNNNGGRQTPQQAGRRTPQQQQQSYGGGPSSGGGGGGGSGGNDYVIDGRHSAASARADYLSQQQHQHSLARQFEFSPISPDSSPDDDREEIIIAVPAPVALADAPPRGDTGTAFSEAQTLVRAASFKSRSSIAKDPLDGDHDAEPMPSGSGPGGGFGFSSGGGEPPVPLRSIFPQYNPTVPLSRQDYFPTQTSPARIPTGVVNRLPYSPTAGEDPAHRDHELAMAPLSSFVAGPAGGGAQGGSQSLPVNNHRERELQQQRLRELQQQRLAEEEAEVRRQELMEQQQRQLQEQQEQLHQQQQQQQQQQLQQQQQQQEQQQIQQQRQQQQEQQQAYATSVAGSQRPYASQPHLQMPNSAASIMGGSVHGGAAPSVMSSRWAGGGGARPAFEAPPVPETSTGDEVRALWKVANGWKATGSEGRVFCLRVSAERDTPVYTLWSGAQPFYHLRIDPTSASAYVTLSRHDPAKPCRGNPPPPINSSSELAVAGSSGGSMILGLGRKDSSSVAAAQQAAAGKNWTEALATTLEAPSRRLPPGDGLVSLLYPSAATKMALERPDDALMVATAERECARLVWDADTGHHFLVHPALATPFCVTAERAPAWSRTEYTLEHVESPHHLAKLTTRDGQGEGWLEIDTAIAGKIDAFFVVDVAVAALMLVAHADERNARLESFEPPPSLSMAGGGGGLGSGGLGSSATSPRGFDGGNPYAGYPGEDDDVVGTGGSSKAAKLTKAAQKKEAKQREKRERERAKKAAKRSKGGKRAQSGSTVEEFDMADLDLESQNSSLRKMAKVERTRDGEPDGDSLHLPGGRGVKAIFKVLGWGFKLVIFCLTIGFKMFGWCFRCCLRGLGEKV